MTKERVDLLRNRLSRVGQVSKNNLGSLMEVIQYNHSHEILVKFIPYGNIVKATWQQFCDGEIKNPYNKSVFGVGYLGEGEYKVYINRKATPQYASWKHMLERVYDDKLHKKHPSYKDCTVAEEWHNFQNFAKWYDENYYEVEGERMHLDKDILVKGNKIYSPETCVFVTSNINSLFTKCDAARGDLPIGVIIDDRRLKRKYQGRCGIGNGKRVNLGSFITTKDAFIAYKSFKEKYIKQIADEYKDKIPTKLYEAMLKYNVEIDD